MCKCSLAMIFALSLATAAAAQAQDYPSRAVRIVTSGVGGNTDFASRQIAQGIGPSLGQAVVVENRGSGVVPGQTVAKSAPDGYTLLVASPTLWMGSLLQKTPYDPVVDFIPITMVTKSFLLLAVHPSLPVKSVKDLIALAKARPGELSYAAAAIGSGSHLAGELFNSMAGTKMVAIPYRSNDSSIPDVISGRVQATFETPASVITHIKSGKLRGLAITSGEPSGLYPAFPTIGASLPGYESDSVQGMFAPAKTPGAIINRLNQEINRFLRQPDSKPKFYEFGLEPVGSSSEEFAAKIKSDLARLAKLIKEAGIKAE